MGDDKRIEDEVATARLRHAAKVEPPAAVEPPVAATLDDTLPAPAAPRSADQRGEGRLDYPGLVTVNPEHYIRGTELARGGMGRIRMARDRRLGRAVAVKELLVHDDAAARRFEGEARITARLQHPSIVNIHEAGVWPSGEPFYAMKLVAGRSLAEVVAAAPTFEERLALLPNVLAVADAMAYAHGERVVHRDLKPNNVLVGAFGETVVIDWGLAKDLGDPGAAADTGGGRVPSGGHDADTAIGQVIGTPAYMPLEQARGNPVDERADVYAIGAILHHVLSGKAPYGADDGADVLEAVKRGPPVPLAERQPGVPADLLAIVDRAMARDPAARYPTARELAADLRRYQTGQLVGAHRYSLGDLLRRWLRRRRAALIVAGVAIAVLAVLGAIALRRILRAEHLAEARRAQAEAQRAAAQDSRGAAEDLLGFMLVNLHDKLMPLGRQDLLGDVARLAVAYYDRRGEQLTDAELAKRGRARRNLGDVLANQGQTDDALRQYRAALVIAQDLAARNPSDDVWQDLSVSHERVGDLVLAQGDAAGALAEYRAALAVEDLQAARDPSNALWQSGRAVAHQKLGDVILAQGDVAGALAEYRAALAIDQLLVARDRTHVGWQRELSISHIKVGDALVAQGDVAGALASYRAFVAIASSLATADPTDAARQRDLAVGHEKIGDVLRAQGNAAAALASYRASLAIYDPLAAKDPTSADRQRDLSVSHNRIGDVLLAMGDAAGALAEYRAALTSREALAAKDPTNAIRQRDLSISQERIGNVLFDLGDPAAALASYQASLALRADLVARDPTNGTHQADLAVAHSLVGDALHAQGDARGALASYRAALAIGEALAAKDSTNAHRQDELAIFHEAVGDVLLAQGDAAGALASYRAALAIAEALQAMAPAHAGRAARAAELAAKVKTCCR